MSAVRWPLTAVLFACAYLGDLAAELIAYRDRRQHVAQMGSASRVRAEEDIGPLVADQFARTVEYIRGLPEYTCTCEACEELWNMPASKVAND